jgi:hypothetical protein
MQQNKIEAIYELREAAEQKAKAEVAADTERTALARDILLDAQLRLESKTADAIEACHECGLPHAPDAPHGLGQRGNVIDVSFGKTQEDDV